MLHQRLIKRMDLNFWMGSTLQDYVDEGLDVALSNFKEQFPYLSDEEVTTCLCGFEMDNTEPLYTLTIAVTGMPQRENKDYHGFSWTILSDGKELNIRPEIKDRYEALVFSVWEGNRFSCDYPN